MASLSSTMSSQSVFAGRARPSLRASQPKVLVPVCAAEPISKPDMGKATKKVEAMDASASSTGVTIEYQRSQAKAMRKYFEDLKYDEAVTDAQVFGWTKANEIGNGRWVMFGLAVGMLTEYATGLSFTEQIKYTISVMGIADIYE